MKIWKLSALALLLLAGGCGAVLTSYAVYRHPSTGDVMECELLHSGGVVSNVPSVLSGDAYAQCKNTLEERGYVRAGTTHHERQARTPSEAARPRQPGEPVTRVPLTQEEAGRTCISMGVCK